MHLVGVAQPHDGVDQTGYQTGKLRLGVVEEMAPVCDTGDILEVVFVQLHSERSFELGDVAIYDEKQAIGCHFPIPPNP